MCSTMLAPVEPVTALARADRVAAWSDDERRRRAAQACQEHDAATLWDLTAAYLVHEGAAGAAISAHTLRTYRRGVLDLVAAWREENLLHPTRHAASRWLRRLEQAGKKPATVRARLAAGRALYAALTWAGATEAAPFAATKARRDPVPAWEKRAPYTPEDVAALLARAEGADRLMVLLGAHAGLRVSEALALTRADLPSDRRHLRVRLGKGGKARTVPLSATLAAEIASLPSRGATPLLPYRNADALRYRLERLCRAAGVPYRGYHALRHACGTRLVQTTRDLEVVARMLGHASIETTRVYAKWEDRRADEAVADW